MYIPDFIVGLIVGYLIFNSNKHKSTSIQLILGCICLGLFFSLFIIAIIIGVYWIINIFFPDADYHKFFVLISFSVCTVLYSALVRYIAEKFKLYIPSKAICFNLDSYTEFKKILIFYKFLIKMVLLALLIVIFQFFINSFFIPKDSLVITDVLFSSFLLSYTLLLIGSLPSFLFKTHTLILRCLVNSFDLKVNDFDSEVIKVACSRYFNEVDNLDLRFRKLLLSNKVENHFISELISVIQYMKQLKFSERKSYLNSQANDLEERLVKLLT